MFSKLSDVSLRVHPGQFKTKLTVLSPRKTRNQAPTEVAEAATMMADAAILRTIL